LELLRIMEALGGDPIEIFREILKRKRASPKLPKR
jgi:hypothetical protein